MDESKGLIVEGSILLTQIHMTVLVLIKRKKGLSRKGISINEMRESFEYKATRRAMKTGPP